MMNIDWNSGLYGGDPLDEKLWSEKATVDEIVDRIMENGGQGPRDWPVSKKVFDKLKEGDGGGGWPRTS